MNRFFKKTIYFGGSVVAFVAVLPMPWRVRVAYYACVDRVVNVGLTWFPSVYDMLTADSVKYNMGKTDEGIISMKILELVIQELDHRGVSPGEVAKVYAGLKEKKMPRSKIPFALAEAFIDEDTRTELFKNMVAG
jgi:hypothetical protein